MLYDDYVTQKTASLLDCISENKTIASTNKKTVNYLLNFMHANSIKPVIFKKPLLSCFFS